MTTHSGVPWSGSGHAAPTHAGDLLLPPGKAAERVPVVVLVHGGFWHTPYDRTLMDALAADCAARGWAAWNIDYCRIEDPEGGWPGTLQDAAAALDFLSVLAEEHPLDLGRVAVVGHSAGGHLALWLGARARLSDDLAVAASFKPPRSRTTQLRPLAVVSLAGVADLVEGSRLGDGSAEQLLRGAPDQAPERYAVASPAALLPTHVPTLLVHGGADDRVPLSQSVRYLERARQAGDEVELWQDEAMGHFEVIDPAHPSWRATAEWLSARFARCAEES
ncbi:MAG: alpha/beta hydrolase family protein [Actinomycetes bacterium]